MDFPMKTAETAEKTALDSIEMREMKNFFLHFCAGKKGMCIGHIPFSTGVFRHWGGRSGMICS